jgi:hypothetical protein
MTSAARGGVVALDVLVVGADIADMREGEGDDLPGIGRVGQDFLIAGHRGVEADLADSAGATSIKDMGGVMAALKGKYAGQMDFAKASAAVKKALSA